jgi:polysaccharide pyruvyl transferase WcaK-like protein
MIRHRGRRKPTDNPARGSHARPRRIGVFGLFGSGNSGNDGSLEATLIFLRRIQGNADVVCFCQPSHSAAAAVSRDYGVAATPLAVPRPASRMLRVLDILSFALPRQFASLLRAVRQTSRLDLLILPGTGNLDDFRKQSLGIPLAVFGWCLAARLTGTRIAFVSVGAGPISNPLSRWLLRSAAALADYRSYRDSPSRSFMEGIGVDTRGDEVYPDLVFGLPAPAAPVRDVADAESPCVGVGIMKYEGWRLGGTREAAIYAAYLARITKFVLWLLDRGHPLRILSGDATDQPAVADVVESVASARPNLPQGQMRAEPMYSIQDLMHQIAQTDLVVATRFHNVVCALKLGKPTVSIGYGQKNDALMADMGVGRFCQQIERLDLDLLIAQFTELEADRARFARSIRRVSAIYEERLHRQEAILASLFLR